MIQPTQKTSSASPQSSPSPKTSSLPAWSKNSNSSPSTRRPRSTSSHRCTKASASPRSKPCNAAHPSPPATAPACQKSAGKITPSFSTQNPPKTWQKPFSASPANQPSAKNSSKTASPASKISPGKPWPKKRSRSTNPPSSPPLDEIV
mgnify:CR=1 FL=1